MTSAAAAKRTLVCISQMRVTYDKLENFKQVEELVKRAKNLKSTFLFLPECCDFVGRNRQETLELSDPFPSGLTAAIVPEKSQESSRLGGLLLERYQNLAKNYSIWLSFGGIHESVLDKDGRKTDKINNSHVIIDSDGKVVSIYRKLHLFDVNTPEFRFRESDIVEAGKCIIEPIKTPIGQVGMQICYDVRFPEQSIILRQMGAEILTYPSAFAFSTGKAHWEILLRARAIENQCYVIAPAQVGYHNDKRQSYGHGMIIDPWGRIIAKCQNNTPSKFSEDTSSAILDIDVAVAEIDLENLLNVRANMPCFEHRRPTVYSLNSLKTETQQESLREIGVENDAAWKFGPYQIPEGQIFLKTAYSFAFTNIRCVVPGHVLVASKRRVKRLKELTAVEVGDFFQTVCKIQKMTEQIYSTTSSTVTVQDGPHAGQTVDHVHCHIMPRRPGDFEHNDEIYVQLNRHDQDESIKRRDLKEMFEEAQLYRNKIRE